MNVDIKLILMNQTLIMSALAELLSSHSEKDKRHLKDLLLKQVEIIQEQHLLISSQSSD
jgi:hypothetical protein